MPVAVQSLLFSLVAGVTISTANAIGFATSRYLQIVRFMTSDCIVWKMGARDAKPRMWAMPKVRM